jgi:hypothetical protein
MFQAPAIDRGAPVGPQIRESNKDGSDEDGSKFRSSQTNVSVTTHCIACSSTATFCARRLSQETSPGLNEIDQVELSADYPEQIAKFEGADARIGVRALTL